MAASSTQDVLLALFQQGRHHEVITQAQAQAVSPESQPLAAQILAASFFQLADYAQAASLLERLEASLGYDANYLSLYGATCRRLGLFAKAEILLKHALDASDDAAEVRNNYANLLIDLQRYDEAKLILEDLLRENPHYADARVNLNRLSFRVEENTQSAVPPSQTNQVKQAQADSTWQPADPLMLAFSDEEVAMAGGLKPAANAGASGLAASLPDPNQAELAAEQLRLAAQAVSEGNSPFALDLCSQALVHLGANASLYANASDAYIKSQRFHEAEICLLHALSIGGPAISHLINLVSLASLRGDLALAAYYLDQAAGLDPCHPQLAAVRANLSRRRQSIAGRPYRFEHVWTEPSVQQRP